MASFTEGKEEDEVGKAMKELSVQKYSKGQNDARGSIQIQDEGNNKPTKITMGLLQKCALSAKFLETASAEQAADALFSIKSIRLDWKNIGVIEGLDVLNGVESIYMQSNRIQVIEGFDFHSSLQFLALQSNSIHRLENVKHLHLLCLDLSHNLIDEEGFDPAELPKSLMILNMSGNPCVDSVQDFRAIVINALPELRTLNGTKVTAVERAKASGGDITNVVSAAEELQEYADNLRESEDAYLCDGIICRSVADEPKLIQGIRWVCAEDVDVDYCSACHAAWTRGELETPGSLIPAATRDLAAGTLGEGGRKDARAEITATMTLKLQEMMKEAEAGQQKMLDNLHSKQLEILKRCQSRVEEMKEVASSQANKE